MTEYCEAQIEVPAADVVAVLNARPTAWLGGFLRLATLLAADPVPAAAPSWFRLGQTQPNSSGGVVSSFIWLPHLGAEIFSRFKGRFVLARTSSRALLVLEGDTIGGIGARNSAMLQTLLDLIASAVSADGGSYGRSMIPSGTQLDSASRFEFAPEGDSRPV